MKRPTENRVTRGASRSASAHGSSSDGESMVRVAWRFGALVACGCAAGACGSTGAAPGDAPLAGMAMEPNASGGGGPGLRALAPPVCLTPPGATTPSSIVEVVDWLNSLPKPVSLPCFLETLPRPLALYASESLFSAQPAVGRRSPRVFLFAEPLTMTIALDGPGSPLLEFGERRSATSSVKGEIAFPVTTELLASDAFEHLIYNDTYTSCSACHAGEQRDAGITFARAFVSQSLRPVPNERVSLSELLSEALACDGEVEPQRCAMLTALFNQAEVVDGDFPLTMETFY